MHYIVYLSVEGLYAHQLGGCDEGALVVHRNRVVIDANPSAQQLGARLGMTLTEAKAMLSGVLFAEWDTDQDRVATDSWLMPLVELSDKIEPGNPHEAYLDLSAHPDPIRMLPRILELIHFPVRMGLGASKWIARASARDPRRSLPTVDLVVRPVAALKPYPTDTLPIPSEMHERLVFLGYRTIGDVQQAPLEVLKKQFGPLGALIFQSSRGGCLQVVEPNYPDETIACRQQLRSSWQTLEERDADLRKIATRLAQPLVDADQAARGLTVTLIDERGERSVRERTFAKPLRTGLQIFSALQGVCGSEDVFEPVEIRARLSELESSRARQYELSQMRTDAPTESMHEAIEAVQATFGSQAVIAGSAWQAPRRQVVMKAWKDATGWV